MSLRDKAVDAIDTIMRETGYPPDPEELAEVLGVSVKSLQSTLTPAKRAGQIGYDEDGRFILKDGGGA